MENVLPTQLLEVLKISLVASIIIMAFIQKIKKLDFVTKDWHIGILNFLFSFLLGIPFSILFYNQTLQNSIWISIFSFLGAPSIYDALKSQNFINYKPTSLQDDITISKENEIKREDL